MDTIDQRLAWIMARISPYYRQHKPMWLSLRDYTVYASADAAEAERWLEAQDYRGNVRNPENRS